MPDDLKVYIPANQYDAISKYVQYLLDLFHMKWEVHVQTFYRQSKHSYAQIHYSKEKDIATLELFESFFIGCQHDIETESPRRPHETLLHEISHLLLARFADVTDISRLSSFIPTSALSFAEDHADTILELTINQIMKAFRDIVPVKFVLPEPEEAPKSSPVLAQFPSLAPLSTPSYTLEDLSGPSAPTNPDPSSPQRGFFVNVPIGDNKNKDAGF